jgi:DNA-binding NarL/FixJ family response regulator
VTSLRVVIADDQPMMRAGFKAVLEAAGDIEVVGEAGNGAEAVEVAGACAPDVVLMDIRMPVMDGIEATRRLPRQRILILTTFGLDDYIIAALRAGASGFLPLDTEPAELVRAVRVVARGEAFLSPGATRGLIAELTAQPGQKVANPEQLEELTAREREVMALAARGLNNDEIAERLVVSPATAKTHVSRAMMKLCARDRAQLVALAYKTGLVQPRKPARSSTPALALV